LEALRAQSARNIRLALASAQSPQVGFDYFFSFFDSLCALENHAYSLEPVAKLIGDETQLTINCRPILAMSGAPVA
jgi:hypothetical protein